MPTIYIKTILNPNDNQYHLHSNYNFVTDRRFEGDDGEKAVPRD